MKASTIILQLLILLLACSPYPAHAEFNWAQMKSGIARKIGSIGKSKADYEKELGYKTAELAAYQEVLEKIEAEIRGWEATTCPTTGEKSIVTLTEDPRPAVREKIRVLEEDVAFLRGKIGE